MKQSLPTFLQPFLWSYDITRLDRDQHKNIIIKNLLNFGDIRSTRWLKTHYNDLEIREVITSSVITEWNKRSINLWSLVYDAHPKKTRF